MKSARKEIQITVRISQQMNVDLKLLANSEKRNLADYIRLKLEEVIELDKLKQAKK